MSLDVARLAREEFSGFHLRLFVARALAAALPSTVGARTRPLLMKLAGFRVGRGTVMLGMPEITGPRAALPGNLQIGRDCMINMGCVFELGASITIADGVALGHEVMLLTTSHEIGLVRGRWGTPFSRPVRIGRGVWLGARSIVLPGVQVGDGAVVGAAAVVTRDVPPNTLVAGVPARPVRALEDDERAASAG